MLTQNEIELIHSCKDRLAGSALPMATEFYERFFRQAPELKHLFERHTKDQSAKLVEVLLISMEAADNLEALSQPMQRLGKYHARMGLEPRHFKIFGETLSITLAHHVRDWSAQDHQAWSTLYKFLTHQMRLGMQAEASS